MPGPRFIDGWAGEHARQRAHRTGDASGRGGPPRPEGSSCRPSTRRDDRRPSSSHPCARRGARGEEPLTHAESGFKRSRTARVLEVVDGADSKSAAERRGGSSPSTGTNRRDRLRCRRGLTADWPTSPAGHVPAPAGPDQFGSLGLVFRHHGASDNAALDRCCRSRHISAANLLKLVRERRANARTRGLSGLRRARIRDGGRAARWRRRYPD